MTIDDLKKALEGSDLGAVLPDLNAIMDKMAPIMRIALLAGPIIPPTQTHKHTDTHTHTHTVV